MMEFLQKRIAKIMTNKLKKATLNEELIEEVMKEIRVALLEADVNYKVVKSFINNVKTKALGQYVDKKLNPYDLVIKIVHDELTEVLGGSTKELNISQTGLTKIMVVGLQGSGKTTSAAKLALHLTKKYNKKPMLVAADIYRPAAIQQLETLAKANNISFFEKGQIDPVEIAELGLKEARKNGNDVVIIDTAGRLHIDDKLMIELSKIKSEVNPDEIILVVDSMTGQDIINVAEAFNTQLNLTGLIITKLDSDARGGAALSIVQLTKVPIKFIGTGEKVGSLDKFHPERMADRILGMGDVVSLVEKVQDNIDENEAKKTMTRMLAGKFDLEDLLKQTRQIKNLGSLGGLMKMIPGAKALSEEQETELTQKIKTMEVLLNSMTLKERRNPKLLNEHSRKQRILKGSGRTPQEFNQLIRKWEQAKEQITEVSKHLKMGKNPFKGGFGI